MNDASPEAPLGTPVAVGETVLTNAQLVLPDEVIAGSVRVVDGRIADVSAGASSLPGAVDCGGDFLAPGLIELHTDNLERHLVPRPGVKWPRRNAIVAHDAELASTGITTVFDALRAGSLVSGTKSRYGRYARDTCNEILDLRAKHLLKISHFIHIRAEICSETLIEELDEFGPEDRIGIVSLMDHTPGQRQFANLAQFRIYMGGKYSMSEDEVEAHIASQKAVSAKFGAAHEEAGARRARELGAILASHDDTLVEHVEQSARNGVGLAEFPTTMEAARASHDKGIAVMMGAPNVVRGGSHSGNVAADELADAGLLDILSSDYVPAALLMGAVMLGERLGNIAKGLATVTAAPAKATHLEDRGVLEVGRRADFVRFAINDHIPMVRAAWVQGVQVA
ncbi:MAG: alpha-D-ribose 1-methylphosphonate 5-triphosphate diphosphatase [Pseudomonadota bacterium]